MDYTLGWVMGDTVHSSFFGVVVGIIGKHQPELAWVRSGPLLYLGRNLVADMFINQPKRTPSLVMVDTDMVFGTNEIDALLAHPEPIVSGVYVDSEGELVRDGCGFLKIDREVLEALGPWPFDPVITEDGSVSGEDVGFRRRARAAGFEIVTDAGIRLGHVKQVMLWPDGTESPQTGPRFIGRPVPAGPTRLTKVERPDGPKF